MPIVVALVLLQENWLKQSIQVRCAPMQKQCCFLYERGLGAGDGGGGGDGGAATTAAARGASSPSSSSKGRRANNNKVEATSL